MSDDFDPMESNGNRDVHDAEAIAIQRSLLFIVKAACVAIIPCLITGVIVGGADHFKLISVENGVNNITSIVTRSSEDAVARNESMAVWRATTDTAILQLRAKQVDLESRLRGNKTSSNE